MSSKPPRSRVAVGLCLLVAAAFLGSLGFKISVPAVAFYTRGALKASMLGLSLIFTAFMAARALTATLIGYLVDRRPRLVYVAPVMLALASLLIYAYSYANSLLLVCLLRCLHGVTSGGCWPLVQLVVASAAPLQLRGRALSVYFALGSIGILLGDVIYAYISGYPMTAQLLVSAAMVLAASLLIALGVHACWSQVPPRQLKPAKRGGPSRRSEDGRNLAGQVIAGGLLVSLLSSYAQGDVAYVYVSEALGLDKPSTALLMAACSLGGITASYLLSWVADKLSDPAALTIAIASSIVALPLSSMRSLVGITAGLALASTAMRSYMPLSRRYLATYTSKPATSIGLVNATSNIGSLIGQLAFGEAYDTLGWTTIASLQLSLAPLTLALAIPPATHIALTIYRNTKTGIPNQTRENQACLKTSPCKHSHHAATPTTMSPGHTIRFPDQRREKPEDHPHTQ